MSTISIDPAPVLARVQLFADMSAEEIEALAHRTVVRHAMAGETIFNEGDHCEGLFVVQRGEVKVFKVAASGREQVLTIEREGDSFAEVPVFDGGPYPASAATTENSVLLFIGTRDLRAVILEHPEIGLKLLKIVGRRLRRLVYVIEELSFTTVRGRLAMQLVRLAKTEGQTTSRGREIVLPSNQDVASQIGTVRELVSRNLSRLQVEGLLRMEGKRAIIPDVEALAAAAEA